jgi:hypothetical protein
VDRCFLDTNVLIDVSRKNAAAIAFLAQQEKASEVCCSIVSNFEMISGARNKRELKTIVDFLNRFTILMTQRRTILFIDPAIRTALKQAWEDFLPDIIGGHDEDGSFYKQVLGGIMKNWLEVG